MVERCPEKAGVGSSILPLGTIFVGGVPQLGDCGPLGAILKRVYLKPKA